MLIIKERQTMQDLRAAGFTERQAEVLAEKLEATAQATTQDLKTFIIAELDKRFSEVDKRFSEVDKRFSQVDKRFSEVGRLFSEMEAKFERALRLQLTTVLTAFVALLGLAVAIIKLFPNAH